MERALAAERLQSGDADGRPTFVGLDASARIRLNKRLTAGLHTARELRNEVEAILAYQSDSSADQAAFLTGGSRKFAAKALIRAGGKADSGQLLREIQTSVVGVARELPGCLRRDALCSIRRLAASRGVMAVARELAKDISAAGGRGEAPAVIEQLA